MTYVAELPTSAHRETTWARALRDGLNRHGPTPTYDAVVEALAAPTTHVEKVGDEWVATCDHEHEVWTIHRGTRHNAQRSLDAHRRHEHGAGQ